MTTTAKVKLSTDSNTYTLTPADMDTFNAMVRAQGYFGAAQSSVGQTQLWNFFGVINDFAYDHYRLSSNAKLKSWLETVFKVLIDTKTSYEANGSDLTGAGMYMLYMYYQFNATCIDPQFLLPNDQSKNGFPDNCDQRGGKSVPDWDNPLPELVPWLFFYWGYWHPPGNNSDFYTAIVNSGVLLQNEINKQKGSTSTIALTLDSLKPAMTFAQIQQFQQSRFDPANWTNYNDFVTAFTGCSLWQDQKTMLKTLLKDTNLNCDSYLLILYLITALSASNVADQQLAQKILNTVTGSMEYANETFMNQLVYLILMQMADPLGDFAYNNTQLKTVLTNLINAIVISNAASKIILTSLQNHLKILNSDASYPMQDPYNPNIGFNSRLSDTIEALDQARGTMSL